MVRERERNEMELSFGCILSIHFVSPSISNAFSFISSTDLIHEEREWEKGEVISFIEIATKRYQRELGKVYDKVPVTSISNGSFFFFSFGRFSLSLSFTLLLSFSFFLFLSLFLLLSYKDKNSCSSVVRIEWLFLWFYHNFHPWKMISLQNSHDSCSGLFFPSGFFYQGMESYSLHHPRFSLLEGRRRNEL